MKNTTTSTIRHTRPALIPAVMFAFLWVSSASAMINGVESQTFAFTASSGHITNPDGNSILVWGYANSGGGVQYPGPTMIVQQGQPVSVTLTNELAVPVSIVFPGQTVTASGGVPGLLTHEAPPDGFTAVTYTFTPDQPGTYLYYSGTRSDLQVEMGLVGAMIVRPANFAGMKTAYGDARSAYDVEFLFLLTEMDQTIHELVEFGRLAEVDTTDYWPVYWFINGRGAPDTMIMAGSPLLPTQPYNCMPRLNPGKRMLLRFVGAGRDAHPFHTHANNFDLIARDGRVLESTAGASRPGQVGFLPDRAVSDFTQTVMPGATYDAIFTWTGRGLGWDIYGTVAENPHTCTDVSPADGFDDTTYEYCLDHDKPIPVTLPPLQDLTFGQHYSGSPYLGAAGFLPPGEGGFNMNGGLFFMWHSHNEKEMTNNDIFPGGMMTMFIVEPPGVVIP